MKIPLLLASILAAAPALAQSTRVGDKKYDGQKNDAEYKTNPEGVGEREIFESVQWIIKHAKPPKAEDSFLRMMVDAPKIVKGVDSRMGYERIGDALRVLVEDRPAGDPFHDFVRLPEPYRTAVKKHAEERMANRAYSDYFKRVRKEFKKETDLQLIYWEIASNMVVYTPGSTAGKDKDTGRIIANRFILLPFNGDKVDFEKPPVDVERPRRTFATERLSNMFADVAAVRPNALVHIEETVSPAGRKSFIVKAGKQPGLDTVQSKDVEAKKEKRPFPPTSVPYGRLYELNTEQEPGFSANVPLGKDIAQFLICSECGTDKQVVLLIKVISANPGASPDRGSNRPRLITLVQYDVDGNTGEVNVASAKRLNKIISDDPAKQRHPDDDYDNWVFNPYVIKDWNPAH